ncbi:MAG: sigma-70 family RNA polymerase sigma factor [Cyclobacteriaceae bacterium]
MKDELLVLGLQNGDTTVLKHCYQKAFGQVKAMVLKNSGSDEDAKDTFHDTLLIFYQNCKQQEFELTSALSTYLYAISWRVWMSRLKSKKSMTVMPEVEFVDEMDFELKHQSASPDCKELMQRLKEFGKNCLEILVGWYYHQLSYAELAEELKYTSEQGVREQKYRCLKRMRTGLKKEEWV